EDKVDGFAEGYEEVLRSLANQVAVTIRNAQLFEEVEQSLADAQALQRRYIEQGWSSAQVTRRGAGQVRFSLGESTTIDEMMIKSARELASEQTKAIPVTLDRMTLSNEPINDVQQPDSLKTRSRAKKALVAPIRIQNTVIGNLQLHDANSERVWTEQELALIEAVVDQVAQAAENLRLFNQTQERSDREQLLAKISDKLRRAPDLETLMKIGVDEISQALSPTRSFVQFGAESPDNADK
ncbi:MAG: GAF domain-containing protein, partial [Chloroflexota bacterium]